MAASLATLGKVLLVVLLGEVEGGCRLDLGDDWLAKRPERSRVSMDRLALSSCSGEWKKIAERYWHPMSHPWRLRVVGLWLLQNTSRSWSYETFAGS